ncbi:AraC-like DNA-binding protein [Epilithonimonas hungarica]|uniref:tetratricopeptide repeat protein n=1 Tax=Epilithonimonas hungarica TaxID=454006 RepID=UPI002787C763|nr:tetratricopeptide repeat protein [Epilithonimonas hungarica]MDP9956218.1 AraC-like DNA-binding protein [Epilithonimonas hungarica]
MMLISVYMIFGYSLAQTNERLVTRRDIDKQLEEARALSVNDPKRSIELSENIYRLSKSINYKTGILESSMLLMIQYYDSGNFKKVIDLSKLEEEQATIVKDNEILANLYRLRGLSYTALGFNEESAKELKKALDASEKITFKNIKNYQKALIFNGLAEYYAHINAPVDSVIYYQRKSLETINKMDNDKKDINRKYYILSHAYINLGKSSSATRHFKDAEIYFSKALGICKNKEYNVNKVLEITVLNEFAWLYHDQKKYDKAILYARQAEELEKGSSTPYIRRDIYEVFFKSYVEQGNKEASKKYMDLYTKLNDSLVNAEKKTINIPVKYIAEKQEKTYRSNVQTILLISTAFVILFLISGLLYMKRNKRRSREKYEAIIHTLKEQKKKDEPIEAPIDKPLGITDDTVNTILLKLRKFESSQKFLRKDMNLTYLANSLNTNTRYLSEVIKQDKGKNFSNYINGLRIQYIVEMLYNVPQYREYKISYLAEVSGFASREVFAVTFKKETGFTPSYFINKLRSGQD